MENKIRNFLNRAEKENLGVEGFLFWKGEEVVFEHRFTPDLPRNIYSHTKSFMAAAVGLALDQGKISLSDKAADYFPEEMPENGDERLKEITLEHLLTMSSGLEGALLMMPNRGNGEGGENYARYLLSRPITHRPGTFFQYSNGDSYLAGRMAEKALGRPLEEELREKVFEPLGIEKEPVWERDPQGHVFGGSGLQLKLRDMNKLGVLFLNEGCWQGKRILSGQFVRDCARVHISTNPHPRQADWNNGYGFQCWKLPYDQAYRFDGAFGQFSCIFPKQGVVVGIQSKEQSDGIKTGRVLHEELFSDW